MKELHCLYCDNVFYAKRSDAQKCSDCIRKLRNEYSKSEHARTLRAKRHRIIREAAYAGYGGECVCCGESEFEFLCIDHVNGGGAEDRKKHSTWQIARRVIELDFPEDYQVLCHNCNLAKGFFGECPHQRKRVS